MESPSLFERDLDEPLATHTRQVETPRVFGNARCLRFEFSSRGDRVPGRLLLPATGSKPPPLILLQHGLGGSKEAAYMDAAAPWVLGGAAVASLDFPLHGERRSSKLSAQFAEGLDFSRAEVTPPENPGVSELLWIEFTRQAVLDLRRCLDALTHLPDIDASRVVYAGFSLGAIVGSIFCGVDDRPAAAALALAGGGFGPAEIDPCRHIGKVTPRPLLFVNARRDERVPKRATEALFDAAADPKSIEWFDADHQGLPGRALKTMWEFLRAHLGLAC